MECRNRPTSEEVITKLKDDGDFDTLRLKIIRKLKENEELRNSIISEVKQSKTLNLDGAENLKPRQLSDAIHQEIGNKIMGQISDEVWKIIRSNDNMKSEITETVESVYNRIINPKREKDRSPSPREQPPSGKEDNVSPIKAPTCETGESCGSEPNEPPGFALCDQQTSSNSNSNEENKELLHDQRPCAAPKEELHEPPDLLPQSNAEPPGFAACGDTVEPVGGVSDDDPDVPPGFG